MTAVGIDFGTTNCVLAEFKGGKPQAVPIDTPPGDWAQMGFDKVLPSVFAIQSDPNAAVREQEPGPTRTRWATRFVRGLILTSRPLSFATQTEPKAPTAPQGAFPVVIVATICGGAPPVAVSERTAAVEAARIRRMPSLHRG